MRTASKKIDSKKRWPGYEKLKKVTYYCSLWGVGEIEAWVL